MAMKSSYTTRWDTIRKLMDGTEYRPEFKFSRKSSGCFQFLAQSPPFEARPVGRPNFCRPDFGHDSFIWPAGCSFWEMEEASPGFMGLTHEVAHFRPTGTKR